MKKILASILIFAVVITSMYPIQLVNATTTTTETSETTQEDGIKFNNDDLDYYYSDEEKAKEVFNQFPATFEATIRVTSNPRRPGTILGNTRYEGKDTKDTGTFLFGFYLDTVPFLYVADEENPKGISYTFDVCEGADTWESVIETTEWVHFAIVNDTTNKEMYCYVDGVCMGTLENTCYEGDWSTSTFLCLGGDRRRRDTMKFRDEIKNVAVYSDVRSSDEIAADAEKMTADGEYTPDADEALMACYSLSTTKDADGTSVYPLTIEDKSGNGLDMKTPWVSEAQAKEKSGRQDDYEYSMAVIGDPQVVTAYDAKNGDYDGKVAEVFTWVKENAKAKNMQFAFNMGDTVDSSVATTEEELAAATSQWVDGSSAVKLLNGTVPYSIVRGNHDSIAMYNQYYTYAEYKDSIAGSYDENMLNTYQKFQVGDIKYLVLNLDFGVGASYTYYEADTEDARRMSDGSGNPDKVLAWANEVVKANPEYNVILTTHGYTSASGTRLQNELTTTTDAPTCIKSTREGYFREYSGEDIYDKLVKDNSNIVLVLSGHIGTEEIMSQTVTRNDGSTVVEMLVNPQTTDQWLGLTGMVAMLYFSDGGKTVQVEYYSTLRDRYYRADNQFEIKLNVIDDTVIEGENGSVFLKYDNVDTTGDVPTSKMEDYQSYLFAGWYSSASGTSDVAIKNQTDVTADCYAKFVPKDVLSVKVQVTNDILTGETSEENASHNGKYVIRFISSVESLNYSKVGFVVNGRTVEFEGESESTTVFTKIKSSNKGSEYNFSPKVISAQSEYFITAKLPVASDDKDTDYIVQAYWETYDGTRVYGESRCVCVNDNNSIIVKEGETRENDVINITVNGELEDIDTYKASFTSSSDNTEGATDDDYTVTATSVEVLDAGDGYTNVRIKLPKGDIENMASLTKITIDNTEYYGMFRYYDTTHESGNVSAPHADTSWYDEVVALDSNADTFVIASSADLYGFATLVDGGTFFENKTVTQVSDIQVNDGTAVKSEDAQDGVAKWTPNKDDDGNDKLSYLWNPIGEKSNNGFKGTFDGDNNTISGLYTESMSYAGLFASLNGTSSICNVKLMNSYIESTDYVGIVAYAYGEKVTCHNLYSDAIYVTFTEDYEMPATEKEETVHEFGGGIVGRVRGGINTIQNCWFDGEISGQAGSVYIGGIVGQLFQTSGTTQNTSIVNCLNTGVLYASNTGYNRFVGGILGDVNGGTVSARLENCVFDGKISTKDDSKEDRSGLLVAVLRNGHNMSILDCYANGDATIFDKDVEQDASVVQYKGSKAVLSITLHDTDSATITDCKKTETELKSIIENQLSSDYTWISYEDNTENTVNLPALEVFKEWWLETKTNDE